MLDNTTKRRIDTARDILVGKVPDPKSQVEQITIALIYKFMDDMDKEAVGFGGLATFFTGEYEKYAWTKIFDPKLGGYEMLNLYSEAILKLNQNPNIPQLFRDIFKNAYLPYRDPETLKLFLKTINEFSYDHSEMLGDAFEYLLSVLGSQGDAGQFRTPRHIIDFMVRVVAPKKGETICDPACGTAGFLISSYKYIVEQNTKKTKGDLLTPDDRKKMMKQFAGYDISPDMVRLSLVNMYLHGFTSPKILEYDTLTSEERWNEYYDIILANPPFMTPKGGIKPHKKFTIQASKSEVLFTDYIAEHINPVTGRAAIIVPNGIVATSQTAYKQLRKMLVKQSLIAVISLPAGVFQPYSGVKTSVLILDKRLAKKANHILFLKIENDGFDLGAQRREIEKNDLPLALQMIDEYKNRLSRNSFDFGDYFDFIVKQNHSNPLITKIKVQAMATLVEKEKVLENKDVVLSAERYFEIAKLTNSNYDIVNIHDYCNFKRGTSITKKDVTEGCIPVIAGGQQAAYYHNIANRPENTITVSSSGAYAGFVNFHTEPIFASDCFTVSPKSKDDLDIKYLFHLLKSRQQEIYSYQEGGGQPHIYPKNFENFQIPLPPLSIQQQIVAEIEGYQKIIDGAKQIVNNYKPVININPEWEMVELAEACIPKIGIKAGPFGSSLKKSDYSKKGYKIYGQEQVIAGDISIGNYYVSEEKFQQLKSCNVLPNDILISLVGTIGKSLVVPENAPLGIINPRLLRIRTTELLLPAFLRLCLIQDFSTTFFKRESSGGTMEVLSGDILKRLLIPLPSITEQEFIVNCIEEEMQLVAANKRLIEIFEQKIKDKINEVWGVKEKKYEEEDEMVTMAAEE
ncbi:MAG TPA: N-6 DNA methylase [Hanamia sp.]